MIKQSKKIQTFIYPCDYCREPAQLICSRCEQAYYCKNEHQKLDWKKKHAKACKTVKVKKEKFYEEKFKNNNIIFNHLANKELKQAADLFENLLANEKKFKQQFPSVYSQIEYGSTMCIFIRISLLMANGLNKAQERLQQYLRDSSQFLSDTKNVPALPFSSDIEIASQERKIALGKLKLISALTVLTHDTIRNALQLIELLINHVEIIYGQDSLETANVYFYAGNYYMNLNSQSPSSSQHINKALACYLKAGRIRGDNGGIAYYNVALLLKQQKFKALANEYFQKALILVEKEGKKEVLPPIYQNLAILAFEANMVRTMIDYFQKALFHYQQQCNKPKCTLIRELFRIFRRDIREDGLEEFRFIDFPKEKKERKKEVNISPQDYQNFKNAQQKTKKLDQKDSQWIESFKGSTWTNRLEPPSKWPKELQILLGNDIKKGPQADLPKYLAEDSSSREQGLDLDITYMRTLTSTEVECLHQLNRLLSQCKQRAAIYDIVENSNFYQSVQHEPLKLHRFFKLNPQLIRPNDFMRRFQVDPSIQPQSTMKKQEPTVKKEAKTPKLDLSKLNSFRAVH